MLSRWDILIRLQTKGGGAPRSSVAARLLQAFSSRFRPRISQTYHALALNALSFVSNHVENQQWFRKSDLF